MVSLHLLIVLSVISLIHCAPLAENVPKCEHWAWSRNGDEPAFDYGGGTRREEDCPSGVCITISVHYEALGKFIRSDARCLGEARPLAASYECEPPKIVGGGQRNTEISCFCKAGTDSLCNRPELMFDPEGDDGQKSRALELRKIGILTEAKTTGSGREIALKFDDDFGKTTVEPTIETTTKADVPATTSEFNPIGKTTIEPTIETTTKTFSDEDDDDDDDDEEVNPNPKPRNCGAGCRDCEEYRGHCKHGSGCMLHWAPLADKWDPACECTKFYIGNHCDQPYDPNVFAAPDQEPVEEDSSTVARPTLIAAMMSLMILWR